MSEKTIMGKSGQPIPFGLTEASPAHIKDVKPPQTSDEASDAILDRHAKMFDDVVGEARKSGPVDEKACAQAKTDYLKTLGHVLQNSSNGAKQHLDKLTIKGWSGANDTLYNADHHAIHIGDKAMQGGWSKHAPRLSHMVIHQLGHALDHRNGKSVMAEQLKGFQTDAWTPKRVAEAEKRPELYAPRLMEYALNSPKGFAALAKRAQQSQGIDLQELLHRVVGVDAQPQTPTAKAVKPTKPAPQDSTEERDDR